MRTKGSDRLDIMTFKGSPYLGVVNCAGQGQRRGEVRGEGKLTSMNLPPRMRGSAQPISTLGGSTWNFEGTNGACVFQLGNLKGNGIAKAAEARARKGSAGSMMAVGVYLVVASAPSQHSSSNFSMADDLTCITPSSHVDST